MLCAHHHNGGLQRTEGTWGVTAIGARDVKRQEGKSETSKEWDTRLNGIVQTNRKTIGEVSSHACRSILQIQTRKHTQAKRRDWEAENGGLEPNSIHGVPRARTK